MPFNYLLWLWPLMPVNTEGYSQQVNSASSASRSLYGRTFFELPASNKSNIFGRAVENKCGPEFGSCPPGVCCSEKGFCNTGKDWCAAPNCLIDFGPGCDANKSPTGVSTADIPRTKTSQLPYGGKGIYNCKVPGTVALTFDDGPESLHTSVILDLLDKYNSKATFFINGNSRGRGMIDDPATPWPDMLRRIYDAGHQIGSHSWSHQDLSNINSQQRKNQIIYNEMAINNVLGVIPTYMRPPYSSCESECQLLLEQLGYHITYFDIDTQDTDKGGSAAIGKSNFDGNLTITDHRLVISHDIQPETANVLTEHMLKGIQAAGLKAVTVGDCLNEPPENWYRLFSGAPFVPPKSWARFVPPEAPKSPEAPVAKPSGVANPSIDTRVAPSRIPTVPPTLTEAAPISTSSSDHGHSSTGSKAAPSVPLSTSSPQSPPSTRGTGGAATNGANASYLSRHSARGNWLFFGAMLFIALIDNS